MRLNGFMGRIILALQIESSFWNSLHYVELLVRIPIPGILKLTLPVNFYGSSHLMIFKFFLAMKHLFITRDIPEETFAKS